MSEGHGLTARIERERRAMRRARRADALTSVRSRPLRWTAAVAGLVALGCATAALPPPGAAERAEAARSYSARLRVNVKGADLRARTQALVAFRRPDALRVEIPGAVGPRFVAVTREATLVAIFPDERAVYEDSASAEALASLLGVRLAPSEVMDVLVGKAPASAARYRARWGPTLPREIDATLADGTRLAIVVEDPEADLSLPAAAFDPPPHDGYRRVDADEARRLWGGR